MKTYSVFTPTPACPSLFRLVGRLSGSGVPAVGLLSLMLVLLSGCQTVGPEPTAITPGKGEATVDHGNSAPLTLREGDVVKVTVPSAPNLDTTQPIRRDGRIALALVGEVQAAGLTPADLQAALIQRYGPQLVSKEVIVTVVSSSFSAFVSGAVLHPGKIVSDHPVTVLEAIMEAGGPDYAKANLKSVTIVRQSPDGRTQNFAVNVKAILEGKNAEPFFLKPSDVVYVPDRLVLF